MTSDANVACADMTLADAIQDLATRTGESRSQIRSRIIESGAYDALYDEETGLWATGPEYFIDFFLAMERSKAQPQDERMKPDWP